MEKVKKIAKKRKLEKESKSEIMIAIAHPLS